MVTPGKKLPRSRAAAPHDALLDPLEREQAEEHSSIRALVIHEVLREEGEEELKRPFGALAWSGLAAGMSLGFSFLGLALMSSALPPENWARLISSVGYTLGFLVVILGRQALFTESTLTAVLPVLVRRDKRTLLATLRFWAIVLTCNLIGTCIFAALISVPGTFSADMSRQLLTIARLCMSEPFVPTMIKAILAGWIIALMVWLLPSAQTAKMFVIMFLTYIVGVGQFPHVIAGSVESAYAVIVGSASIQDYFVKFLAPTMIGNVIGGVAMVAILNHAPLAVEMQGTESSKTYRGK